MKKYFFTGLIILLPVALTLTVIVMLFNFFTTPFVPIVTALLDSIQTHLSFTLPQDLDAFLARIISLLLLCLFVLVLGIVARWFIVRNLIRGTHALFSRIPFIKTVFNVSRDVFSALFSREGKKAFKCPVMIPFPDQPNHSLGFVVGEVPKECQAKWPEPLAAIFTPTAPHPISGFLLFVPKKDLTTLDMTNEDAVRFLISCGMIVPDDHEK